MGLGHQQLVKDDDVGVKDEIALVIDALEQVRRHIQHRVGAVQGRTKPCKRDRLPGSYVCGLQGLHDEVVVSDLAVCDRIGGHGSRSARQA